MPKVSCGIWRCRSRVPNRTARIGEISALKLKFRRNGKQHTLSFSIREPEPAPYKVLFRRRFDTEQLYHFFEFAYRNKTDEQRVVSFRIARNDDGEPDFERHNPVERVRHPQFLLLRNSRTALEILNEQILQSDHENDIWSQSVEARFLTNAMSYFQFGSKRRRIMMAMNLPPFTPFAFIWHSQPKIMRQLYIAVPVTSQGWIDWNLAGDAGPR